MSNMSSSDALDNLFSGFPEDEVTCAGRCLNMKTRLGDVSRFTLSSSVNEHLLRNANISQLLS